MESRRSERVSEAIREELEEILNYELTDPRIGTVAVPEVVVASGGRRALVRVAIEGDAKTKKRSMDALEGARGHIRRLLAERVDLFRTPEIEFEPALSPVSDPKLSPSAAKSSQRPSQRPGQVASRSGKRSPEMKHCVLLLLLAPLIVSAGDKLRISSSFDAMGATFTIVAYDESRSKLQSSVDEAFEEVRRLDLMLSNYRKESEWSRVNREAAAGPVADERGVVPPAGSLYRVQRSQWRGVRITVGPLLKVWGFTRAPAGCLTRRRLEPLWRKRVTRTSRWIERLRER